MTALTIVLQWVHIVAAIVWFGAQVFVFGLLWPALLRRPVGEARGLLGALMPAVSRVMGPSALIVVLSGLLRGTVFGPLRSWASLTTPYGLSFLVALAVVAGVMVNGSRMRVEMPKRVFGDGAFAPGAQPFLRRQAAIAFGALTIVLACMVLMRFGL